MDGYEATRIVFSRIQSLDPENASKIMGLLLIQDHGEKGMIRLAFGPEALVHSLVLKARKELGLSSPSSSPNSPFTNSTLSRQNSSSSSSRLCFNIPPSLTIPNPSSSNGSSSWSDHDLVSPSNSTLNPASLSFYANGGGGAELVEEFQLQDQLPFLKDNSSPNLGQRSPDLYYSTQQQQLDSLSSPTGGGSDMYWGGSGHRRSCSFSDVLGSEDPSSGYGWRPCLYYARGFCKNGSNCRFVHGGIGEVDGSSMVGSPNSSGKIELMEQCHDMLRSATNKSAQQQQRLAAAASQLMASSGPASASGSSSFPYSPKCMNFLLQQQQHDGQRAAAALMMGEEIQKFGRCRLDRNDLVNPASRQIYLTFPADSTFREEDVSSYFSIYGPVQDVRIPYQQKRMFGFVTFVYPETVKIILAKGNPHFVCDARVLVKPYKEKGKVPDKFRKQAQQVERGDFSPCGTPTGLESRDPFDLPLGSRMFYNTQDMLWKRKLEEQADLQGAIELQSRRLMGFQLLDVKKQHHHRALSTGSPIPSPTHSASFFTHSSFPPLHATTDLVQDNCSSPVPAVSITAPPEKQAAISSKDPNGSEENGNGKASSHGEKTDLLESLEHNLPDSPFASPTKGSADHFSSSNVASSDADKDATIPPSSSSNNNLVTSTLIPDNPCEMTSFKSFNCQLPRFSSGHGAIGMYAGTEGPTCPVGI